MNEGDLLLADLDHFGESLWRNEEVGEKRLTFFIGVVTAVATGLVLLNRDVASDEDVRVVEMHLVASAAVAVLLVLGLLSYFRMLQRNAVSDEYKETMHEIRRRYISLYPSLAGYRVPPEREKSRRERWFRGGYAETFAVLDGILLTGFVALVLPGLPLAALAAGAGLSVVLWYFGSRRDNGSNAPGASSGAPRADDRSVRPPADAPSMLLPETAFRAGVGAAVRSAAGNVLVLERSDMPGSWQLPQGGLKEGEDPLEAVHRELEEETGLGRGALELLGQVPEPLAYELPPEMRSPKTGRGQVHAWFIFAFRGDEAAIRLPEGGEFRAWSWRPLGEVAAAAIEFRRPAYRRLDDFVTEVIDRR